MHCLQTEGGIFPRGLCFGCLPEILINNPNHSSRQQPTESVHNNHEEERRKRVSLAKARRTTKETMQTTINQDREARRGDTSRYPFPPFSTKTKASQKIGKELRVDMVVSFFQLQLANNARNSRLQPTI